MIVFSTDEAVHPFIFGRLNAFIPLIINFPGSDIKPKFTAMKHDVSRALPETLEVCYILRGELLEISARFLSIGLVYEEDATRESTAKRSVWEHFAESIGRSGCEDHHVDLSHSELTMLERVPRERRRGIKELGKSIDELIALLIPREEDRELIGLNKGSLLFCVCWYNVAMNELLGRCFSIDNADICYIAKCAIRYADGSRLPAPRRTGHQDGE
jgi:hypothetical protein